MNQDSFCVLPWIHLATHPDGATSLCCESDHTGGESMAWEKSGPQGKTLLNLSTHSLDQLMNSESFRSVRRQMLQGERPKACQKCYQREEVGVESKRIRENRNYAHFTIQQARRETTPEGGIDPRFDFVELRLSNLCNLKCRTCNPVSSMKWAEDYLALKERLDFIPKSYQPKKLDWTENESLWEDLARRSGNLQTLYINGGEPMLIKGHWAYLHRLVENGMSKRIFLIYSSNLTYFPAHAFPLWKSFKKVRISGSIDDLDARNQYIRHPTRWDDVERSVARLAENGIEFNILQTVSAMNFYYLDTFREWATSKRLPVVLNFVSDPPYLSPAALPYAVRLSVLTRLERGLPKAETAQLKALYSDPEDPLLLSRFLQFTRTLDAIRGESFRNVFPELVEAIEQAERKPGFSSATTQEPRADRRRFPPA